MASIGFLARVCFGLGTSTSVFALASTSIFELFVVKSAVPPFFDKIPTSEEFDRDTDNEGVEEESAAVEIETVIGSFKYFDFLLFNINYFLRRIVIR